MVIILLKLKRREAAALAEWISFVWISVLMLHGLKAVSEAVPPHQEKNMGETLLHIKRIQHNEPVIHFR